MGRHYDADAHLDYIQTLLGERKIVLAVKYGSDLYGTANNDSDTDIRVVFLPTPTELLMGETDFTIDSNVESRDLGAGDIDVVAISFMRFLNMLGKMDMGAVEMLFASQNPDMTLHNDPLINWVYNSKDALLAFTSGSFMKGVRANLGPLMPDAPDHRQSYQDVLDATADLDDQIKLGDMLDTLDALRNSDVDFLVIEKDHNLVGDEALDMLTSGADCLKQSFITVRGSKIQLTGRLLTLRQMCKSAVDKSRKELEKGTAAVGPKQIYQAIRLLDEYVELAADGQLTFPREIASLLTSIRNQTVGEDALKKLITMYANMGSDAIDDMPFRSERCAVTYQTIVTHAHLTAVREGNEEDDDDN